MFDSLAENVALKVNDQIFLDKKAVYNYLKDRPELLFGFKQTDHFSYAMHYGYNALNQPVKLAFKDGLIQRIIIKEKDYPLKRLMLDLSYDGKNYHGFQIQKAEPSVQGILSSLVSEVNAKEILVQGASRTDALVHAHQQIVHFDDESNLSEADWLYYLNRRLPKDIHIKKVIKVHPLFHSRYDVYSKEYCYRIKLGEYQPFIADYAWHVEYLDFLRLNDQLKKVIGEFDFSAFAKSKTDNNTRIIYDAGFKVSGDYLDIYLVGNGFLRYMVRLLVHHIVDYAMKKTELDILEIIKKKSRTNTKHLAPAAGLYLNKITY